MYFCLLPLGLHIHACVCTSCGMKDVLFPVDKKVLLPLRKKMALLPVERALLIVGLCGEVYFIAYGKKNLLGYERHNIYL